MSNFWQNLSQRIQFLEDESGYSIASEEVIVAFEAENKIIFPPDYREFCKIFGSGVAGDLFRFWCPGPQLVDAQEALGLTINFIRKFPSGEPEVDQQKIDVLEHGFVFADDIGSRLLLWDLRTYRDEDSSYDIYLAVWDAPESEILEDDLRFVDRSFSTLIQDFCYGTRRYELYPPDECVEVEYTYDRF